MIMKEDQSPMYVQTQLPADRMQLHAEDMAAITPAELNLARELQQIAFHGRRDYAGFDRNFTPAPLYVRQARVIAGNPDVALSLVRLVEAAVNG